MDTIQAADLCRPFLESLPISGVSITVISAGGAESTLCFSDEVAARIDEIHFELGEGPQWLAASSGRIVAINDLRSHAHPAWPVFGAAVAELPVGAIFSVPMKMGAVTVGVVTCYRDRPGELSWDQQISALRIASAIASTAVQHAMRTAAEDSPSEHSVTPALRREVHQATGMILVQLDATATIAYSRLRAYAFSQGETVQSVAHAVVTGRLNFGELPL
jgi:GAF domain-containing protein